MNTFNHTPKLVKFYCSLQNSDVWVNPGAVILLTTERLDERSVTRIKMPFSSVYIASPIAKVAEMLNGAFEQPKPPGKECVNPRCETRLSEGTPDRCPDCQKNRELIQRTFACVNGCKGIADPENTVPELIEVLKVLVEMAERPLLPLDYPHPDNKLNRFGGRFAYRNEEMGDIAKAALAKTTRTSPQSTI